MSQTRTAPARATEPQAPQMAAEITPLPIHEAIIRAKAEVGPVGKTDRNDDQHFNFRGIDTVVNAVAGALNKYGIILIPVAGTPATSLVQTKRGGTMNHVVLPMTYQLTDIHGAHVDVGVIGEAFDAGDKAFSKAQSVAERVCLIQVLNLPTNEPDPDSVSEERAAPQSAGAAFDNAIPAGQYRGGGGQPNGHAPGAGNGQRNGHAGGGSSQPAPARQQMQPRPPLDPADPWAVKIETFSTPDDVRQAEAELKAAFEAKQIGEDRANQVYYAIRQRADALRAAAMAAATATTTAEPAGAADPTPGPQQGTGSPPSASAAGEPAEDAAWVADFLAAIGDAKSSMALDGLRPRIGQAVVDRKIATATAPELLAQLTARRRELQGASA